ncbi:MAG: methionyl-tRNA formyltransferase [Chloroflexi bacterium]|nr:MAG: methionyl-tRNA formyltransferase [Chloroflexota bacterium]
MDHSTLRIIFMGTPDFAVPALRKLVEGAASERWQVAAAVTQPDRPAGRGKRLVASPVKEYAQAQGLPVLQPQSLRKDPGAVKAIRQLAPDLIVVAAYGLILPRTVLEIPRFGCINIHASLLPAYRGASPITAAILDGLSETGVSIMLMDEGMDTGPVLAQARHAIDPADTTASLSQRLAELGATLLVTTLPQWVSGELKPTAQDQLPGALSYCRLIKKEDGHIDWNQPAIQIERMTRAYTPWPSAYTSWRGEPFKIWQAAVAAGNAEPGRVVNTPQGPAVGSGEGLLLLRTVQPAGKRALDIRSFLNGAPDFIGQRLPN